MESSKFIIEEDDLRFKKLEIQDALEIANWGKHDNELLIDYELAKFTVKQLRIWYLSKRSGLRNKYFAIYNEEDKMILLIELNLAMSNTDGIDVTKINDLLAKIKKIDGEQ